VAAAEAGPVGPVRPVDPFDLPEWLGLGEVTWRALTSVRESPRVTGELSDGADVLGCDLLAADVAFPRPVLGERWRHDAHQAWSYGQVLLVEYDGRPNLAVPGTRFTADDALETLARLAKAVGVQPERFSVTLRL
jgi:hypothetical protein